MPDVEQTDPEGYDAILMAGDRASYKAVYGENKAFLEIEGVPVILYVLSALERSRRVSRVFVVGPRERILRALEAHGARMGIRKPVVVLEQAETVLENARMAFLATLPEGVPQSRLEDKAVLVLGGDIPLVTGAELDEFIQACDLTRYDYVLGMTSAGAMKAYHPPADGSGPGIRFAYFCFRDGKERQNNLHMIRVLRVLNERMVHAMYRFRYQQRWRNVARLLWDLLRESGVTVRVVALFVLLHLCRVLDRREGRVREALQRFLRRFLVKPRMEQDVSRILGARFGTALTTLGGAALDVDNERDFQVIKQRFRGWMSLQAARIGPGGGEGRAAGAPGGPAPLSRAGNGPRAGQAG